MHKTTHDDVHEEQVGDGAHGPYCTTGHLLSSSSLSSAPSPLSFQETPPSSPHAPEMPHKYLRSDGGNDGNS
ncbi:hypothetical protein N7491_003635 [Penicillium cf. griseofulvum]|uniref:Uncharacterized protein n=1 Tax=Penicillium cf. griseofulvum TaxID=2972120 RepID=A0A9W9MQU4_9EURO|nr:hypothetical protein N7472_002188 [Penicillium cf. griseofulvum]KAJ5441229.1 hypothetical protein N7491_003635 [Penicillium cf. griseofulvum]KAJ5449277.1 hypothetical protein N7445_004098 [Penicillium cf. griseofulvum]